jgi:lipopolysaccharide transport system ATP-binding protein
LQSDETVISVQSLSKSYLVGHETEYSGRYRSLRETVVRHVTNFGRKTLEMARGHQIIQGDEVEEFWALQDVSFEILRGEVVGIIGRNGAGKSTLLKILSRITEPTKGRAIIEGRVASLLEVGTGFHPELTGRENIYLNGAILGMRRAEIKAKFDEIVNFADIERFLDTPVKRYSSGMYVRLAFAVAAHLDSEVLIVDEVLAVGDAAFQEKCLAKMATITRGGRTILFVSHQLGSISSLCSRTIVLDRGQISFIGDTASSISHYLSKEQNTVLGVDLPATTPRSGNGKVRFQKIWITDLQGREQVSVVSGQTVVFNFALLKKSSSSIHKVSVGFSLHNYLNDYISILYSDYHGQLFNLTSSQSTIECSVANFPFSAGKYLLHVRIVANGEEADWPQGPVASINVENGDFYNSGVPFHGGIGPVLLSGDWTIADTSNGRMVLKNEPSPVENKK